MWWSYVFSGVANTKKGNKSCKEPTGYSRSPLSRMGTHRSTTTNQQVGLRITETCREASKVAQNEVGEEQNLVDFSKMQCGEKTVIFSLMVRTYDGPTAIKKERENFQPWTSRRKKWRLLISAVRKKVPRPTLSSSGKLMGQLPDLPFQNKKHALPTIRR